MAVMKNVGTKEKPQFVRDEERSTSPNLYGSGKKYLAAKKAEAQAKKEAASKKSKPSAEAKGE